MRRAGGYILLLVLLVVLVLALIAIASLSLGEAERHSESFEHDQLVAQSMAEAGLVRTQVYLSTMLDTDLDLDRALDPRLDTTCTVVPPGVRLAGNQADDHLPPFADGVPVVAGPAGRRWTLVSYAARDAGGMPGGITAGGYLVRIDDNADDGDPTLPAMTTGNNTCPENTAAFDAGQNPVRDRDRTVEVTVVGFYPGGDPARANAVKAVRATFTPGGTGIAANGTVDMGGASHVCERYAGVAATGDILGACLCGAACPGHVPCAQDDPCEGRAGGPICAASGNGGGGACQANETVPVIPRVSPWDRLNAPPRCTGGTCEPFWYLRADGGDLELFQWNYAGAPLGGADGGCVDPQRFARICHPADSLLTCAGASCWQLQQTAIADGGIADLRLYDSAGWNAAPPLPVPRDPAAPVVWQLSSHGTATRPGCGGSSGPWPWPSAGRGLGWDETVGTAIAMKAEGAAGALVPRGTWFVEGNVTWAARSPACSALPLGWRLTLLTAGDVELDRDAALRPSSQRGVVVVTGRDLLLARGATVSTCGESAAFLVHEQASIGGSETLEGQLVVDGQGTCSDRVSGTASLQLTGGAVINVPRFPPVPLGRDLIRVRSSPVAY